MHLPAADITHTHSLTRRLMCACERVCALSLFVLYNLIFKSFSLSFALVWQSIDSTFRLSIGPSAPLLLPPAEEDKIMKFIVLAHISRWHKIASSLHRFERWKIFPLFRVYYTCYFLLLCTTPHHTIPPIAELFMPELPNFVCVWHFILNATKKHLGNACGATANSEKNMISVTTKKSVECGVRLVDGWTSGRLNEYFFFRNISCVRYMAWPT